MAVLLLMYSSPHHRPSLGSLEVQRWRSELGSWASALVKLGYQTRDFQSNTSIAQ